MMLYGKIIAFFLGLSIVMGGFYILAMCDDDVVINENYSNETAKYEDKADLPAKDGTDVNEKNITSYNSDTLTLTLGGTVDYSVINAVLAANGKDRNDVLKVNVLPGTVIKDYMGEETYRGTFENMTSAISIDLEGADTSNMKSMSNMFRYCQSLKNLNISGIDTCSVKSMESMFQDCTKLAKLDLSSLDTSSVDNMESMFQCMTGLKEIKLGEKFNTSCVSDMSSMFKDCISLQALDLSMLDMSSVTTTNNMFDYCIKLSYVKFGHIVGSAKLKDMSNMFLNCERLVTADLSGFNTSNVNDMSSMFEGCKSLVRVKLIGFDSSRLTDVSRMFAGCTGIREIAAGSLFDLSEVGCSDLMFSDCVNLKGGNGTAFDDTHTDCEFAREDGGVTNPGYFASSIAF